MLNPKTYRRFAWPLLSRLDPEQAHDHTLRALEVAQRTGAGRFLLRRIAGTVPRRPISAFGLTFPNPVGVAAGFDKDVQVAEGLALLGFGHVEVGTLTPRPQGGNPRPRIFRLPQDGALINRMGFPNRGVAAAVPRLRHLRRARAADFVLGVSLGKQKETPLVDAAADYVAVMRHVYPYADYLAVNVSSPNTPGLRELQGRAYLEQLLATLVGENQQLAIRYQLVPRPLLLKVAPDIDDAGLDAILEAAERARVSGLIAANTTVERGGLSHPAQTEQGGLSGTPLRRRSAALVRDIVERTGGRLPVIGVGGVRTATDAQVLLDAGAVLVQLYTALVYEGPGLPGRLLRNLAEFENHNE